MKNKLKEFMKSVGINFLLFTGFLILFFSIDEGRFTLEILTSAFYWIVVPLISIFFAWKHVILKRGAFWIKLPEKKK